MLQKYGKQQSRLSGNFLDRLESFQTVQKLSILSGNFSHCPETLQPVWKLSGPSGNFSDGPETFRQSGNFPHLFTLHLMFGLHFLDHSVDTRKNFPDPQKLSGWQCQRANGLFLTLALCTKWCIVMMRSNGWGVQLPPWPTISKSFLPGNL